MGILAKISKGVMHATAEMTVSSISTRKLSFVLIACITIASFGNSVHAIPEYTGYMVNDWAYLLSYEDDAYLESLCRDIEDETTVEIFIVTTVDLEGEDLDRYSYLLFNDWGIGKEDVDNGLLLVLYYEDLNETHFAYEFRVEIGLGLEGAITDSEAGRITRDEIVPWIEYYDFANAFYYGILAFYDEFADDLTVRSGAGDLDGIAAFQAWGYENPWFAGLLIGALLSIAFMWLEFSLRRGLQCIFPLVLLVTTLLFAWWWDGSLAILFYGIVFALGGTVIIRGGSRMRSGGGRSVGGGYIHYG